MNNKNTITIDRLRYFQEVARVQNVNLTAKRLNISASVISAAVQAIETELGYELFSRSKQRISLNLRGQALLKQVEKVLADIANLGTQSESDGNQIRGHYRLGGSHFLMHEHLLPACVELKKGNENLTFEFCSMDTGVALSKLEAGMIDMALVFRSSYYKSFKEIKLYSGKFEVVVNSNHSILKMKKENQIEELNRLPAITFRTSAGGNFWESHPAFGKLGIIPRHTYFYEDTQTALLLLNKTDGWAFLPDMFTRRFLKLKGSQNIRLSKIALNEDIVAPVDTSIVLSASSNRTVFLDVLTDFLSKRISD